MQRKTMRRKLARQLRQELGVDFVQSHNMARWLIKGEAWHYEAIVAAGLEVMPRRVAACGRGCCWEIRGCWYMGVTHKGKFISYNTDDLERVLARWTR